MACKHFLVHVFISETVVKMQLLILTDCNKASFLFMARINLSEKHFVDKLLLQSAPSCCETRSEPTQNDSFDVHFREAG